MSIRRVNAGSSSGSPLKARGTRTPLQGPWPRQGTWVLWSFGVTTVGLQLTLGGQFGATVGLKPPPCGWQAV